MVRTWHDDGGGDGGGGGSGSGGEDEDQDDMVRIFLAGCGTNMYL